MLERAQAPRVMYVWRVHLLCITIIIIGSTIRRPSRLSTCLAQPQSDHSAWPTCMPAPPGGNHSATFTREG